MGNLFGQLPDIYNKFLPSELLQDIPDESMATCGNCIMVLPEDDQRLGSDFAYFSKETKCCTFYPALPNYLVGGLLCDDDPRNKEGIEKVKQVISGRKGVTPHGIFPPRKYWMLYLKGKNIFGKAGTMRCPYYDAKSGGCSIWKYRAVICSTYFCKHACGIEGRMFWESIQDYLRFVEDILTNYVVMESGWPSETVMEGSIVKYFTRKTEELTLEEIEDIPLPAKKYSALWDNWRGKEEDFYKRAFEMIGRLDREKFKEIAGYANDIHIKLISRRLNDAKNTPIPDILRKNPKLKIYPEGEKKVKIISPGGMFELSKEIFNQLDIFNGKINNGEADKLLQEKYKVKLSKELLTSLYQNRILIKAGQ